MTILTDEERQLLLRLLSAQMAMVHGRRGGADYVALLELRRKLEGVDKRIEIHD